ncbi:hypothetical protein G6F57_016596 [Rhizopus arrhizus]|nr:hypothetical protein G6F22_016542 [Rhizopus arrhizus]KAG0919600.1 hypothetical protein G6F32_016060 [Rhizopus arrhizus]KAG1449549.1 hypothetical protein G6F57_016596 [Rhizopus arrhizus]
MQKGSQGVAKRCTDVEKGSDLSALESRSKGSHREQQLAKKVPWSNGLLEGLNDGRNTQANVAVAVHRPYGHGHDYTAYERPQRRVRHMPLHERADCVRTIGKDHADQAKQNAGNNHAQNAH